MDTEEEGSGIEDEKLQLLKQDEKRTRVFVRGESEDIDAFIQSISLENWYKDSEVEGQHAQVNLKYPVYGSKILEAIPPNIFSANTRHSCCQEDANSKKVKLQFLTSNNPYYSLKKMRALKRQHSSSSSSSVQPQSQRSSSSFLNRSGMSNDLDSCSSSLIAMVNSKNEELKLLVTETSKEWMQFMKTQSEQSQKQQSDTNEMMKSLLSQVSAILGSKNFSNSIINEGDNNKQNGSRRGGKK